MSETPVPESNRPTVGSIFRSARERNGVKLDQAAAVTRISKAYLVAIEEDRFDRLPSAAYAKGFMRAYARFLDLPEEDVIAAYAADSSRDMPPDNPDEMPQEQRPDVFAARVGVRRTAHLLIPFLALATAFSIFFLKSGLTPPRGAAPAGTGGAAKTASPPPGAAVEPKKQEPRQVNPDLEKVRPEPSSSMVRGMVLRLRAMEDASLDITIDGAITQHYELKEGDLIEWKGEKGFALDLDNAGGVEAELNGKALAPLGEKGERVHVELKGQEHEPETAP